MLTNFARMSEAEIDLEGVIDSVRRVVSYPHNPSQQVTSFAAKLASVYNTLSVVKTGTVLHLSVTDGPPLVMCLQCVYGGMDERVE